MGQMAETMHEVVTTIDRPEQSVVEGFHGIPTPILADVTTKYENAMSSDIEPVWDSPTMAGTALTVKTYPGDNLMIHKAVTLAEPGDVLVVDANGYTEAGLFGELLSRSCQSHDLQGTVIDGAVRDVEEIGDLEYPVYARGVSPKGSYKAHPGSINVSISCGGLDVAPGDIVVGDGQGVVAVSQDDADAVLEAAEAKLDEEAALRERVDDGEYLFHVADHDEAYEALDVTERGRDDD